MTTPFNGIQVIDGVVKAPQVHIGLSTDVDKPKDPANGECLIQMDTSKILFYDADGEQWLEWGASS